jgi:nucleolar GTP-binding protein
MEEIQMVDTPGLLDRPLYERNDIELQAILALNYLANLVLFIIDASEFCGYTIDEQINLFKEIKELFKVPAVVAINKIDLVDEEKVKEVENKLKDFEIKAIYKISADKDIGLEELKGGIKKLALELYNAKQ